MQLGARFISHAAELAAALIIAAAVAEALWRALLVFARRDRADDERKENLRLGLGRWLAVSLEFLLAADILLTAIAPSWDDIGKLGAIALIRTALNYFLQKETEAQAGRLDKAQGTGRAG
ncbi:hypothetical protein DGo_CA1783 [Deinococcus gobiensis I-0]|uniref:DUF1622 domain-containing protein n=1 Tax=Deinococcus gobiensis (strain DSM 21396 / JCM 16679 / CGMCC 1.7299 / I-0) TaxID=745776 RepID=H8GWG0_DEIGI|nr:hypothetical protein DGo_CA1783 [Deinococcus gobiensis I-0]